MSTYNIYTNIARRFQPANYIIVANLDANSKQKALRTFLNYLRAGEIYSFDNLILHVSVDNINMHETFKVTIKE